MSVPVHLRIAWKEIHRRISEHLIYVVVIALGVASLVATSSFTDSLSAAIEEQTKTLLGADFVVKSRQELPLELLEEYNQQVDDFSDQASFNSMVQFTKSKGTRLVQVRSITGPSPFYGAFETDPPGARDKLLQWDPELSQHPPAIVDLTLLQQFDASVGDEIKLGAQQFEVIAILQRVAGEIAAISAVGPRIYIPQKAVGGTGLLKVGSLARRKRFYKVTDNQRRSEIISELKQRLEDSAARVETVEDRKEDIQDLLSNLKVFLGISGITALLLGLAGVASASFVQARRKRSNAAALLCLGATRRDVSLIYGLQSVLLAGTGAVLGAAAGWLILQLFPIVLLEFLPLDISVSISMSLWAVLAGALVGLAGGVLFSFEALRTLTLTSPMSALRTSLLEEIPKVSRLTLAAITFFLLLAGKYATGSFLKAGIFFCSFAVLLLCVLIAAKAILVLLRKLIPTFSTGVVRQGINNIFRPNNQSLIMILCIALLTFIVSLTMLLQRSLLDEVALKDTRTQPNTILFDIQSDQVEEAKDLLNRLGHPVMEESAIVSMRLRSINQVPYSKLLEDEDIPKWTLRREYRSTFRDHLTETEEIVAGSLRERVENTDGPIPVSLEEGIAEKLKVTLGDTLVFDVQGVELETTIASLREVDWKQVRPNFFVVFPLGVLEQAPQIHVLATRTKGAEDSAQLQRETVKLLPNVSVIDITLVLDTLTTVIDKISFVLVFLGFFIVSMGSIVLGGALATGRYNRLRELVIYRLLGASYQQMRTLALCEFLALGLVGAVIGICLSIAAAALLTTYVLKVSLHGLLPGLAIPAAISMILVLALGAATTGQFKKLAPRQILSS